MLNLNPDMIYNKEKKCENCDFFEIFRNSFLEGHCIFLELNRRTVVSKNINDKCKYYKTAGSLNEEIRNDYYIRHGELKIEWKIAQLKKEMKSLGIEIDGLIENEEETQDIRKRIGKNIDRIDEIEEEIKELGGVVD